MILEKLEDLEAWLEDCIFLSKELPVESSRNLLLILVQSLVLEKLKNLDARLELTNRAGLTRRKSDNLFVDFGETWLVYGIGTESVYLSCRYEIKLRIDQH